MRTTTFALATAAALLLAGCATSYNPEMGATGGSEVSMLTPTRAVVSFTGNGYTSADKVQQYVLLRAAELTYERGFGHFAVISAADDSRTTTVGGFYGSGGYDYLWGTATSTDIVFPKNRIEIEMYPGGKPADAPRNVYNAADVINTVRPTLT